jgi:hypothetical protein
MNTESLRQKLISAARAHTPDARVPYAFEKRIMARLGGPVPDLWATWSSLLWRAAIPCCAIMIAVSAATLVIPSGPEDFDTQLHAVLLAGLDAGADLP